MNDQLQQLLGISDATDAHALLGLSPGTVHDAAAIDHALQRRLTELHQHPDRHRLDVDAAAALLRQAAAALHEISQQSDMRQLTEFDRSVLAILVGYGGWNATSRSRLVSLSMAQGVSVTGLMKVIHGLGEYAKSGSPAVTMSQITPAAKRLTSAAASTEKSDTTPPILQRYLAELSQPEPRTTVKLSVFFGVLTLIIGAIALRVFMPSSSPTSTPQARSPNEPQTSPLTSDPSEEQRGNTESASIEASFEMTLLESVPTRPDAAIDARARINDELAELDAISRRLSVATEPPDAIVRSWSTALETFATAWIVLDDAQSEACERAVLDVLIASGTSPSVVDDLLSEFLPPSAAVVDPIDILRGTWQMRMLGALAANDRLSPVVRDRASHQLDELATSNSTSERWTADRAVNVWLEQVVTELAATIDGSTRTGERWGYWLLAQQAVADDTEFNTRLMNAAKRIMRQNAMRDPMDQEVSVLALLLESADLREPVVYDAVLGWFDDPAVTSQQLWIVSNILARHDRYHQLDDAIITAPDGDDAQRARDRDRLAQRWPARRGERHAATGTAIQVNQRIFEQWHGLLTELHSGTLPIEPTDVLDHVLRTAQLNFAALALVVGEETLARQTLADLQRDLENQSLKQPSRRSSTHRVVTDGTWASLYDERRRNTDEKLELLHELQLTLRSGNDIHHRDAAVLVREVLRGTPADVRELAQRIVVQQLVNGPNVALELLDQLPDAGRSQRIASLLESVTGTMLPDPGEGQWMVQARLALLEYVLQLLPDSNLDLDLTADKLGLIYAQHAALLHGDGDEREQNHTMTTQPHVAATDLLDAWKASAITALAPAMEQLQRRHDARVQLAEGPIQSFVAAQLGVLDALGQVVTAEQPQQAELVEQILQRSSQRRSRAEHIFHQAAEVERAMNLLWNLRMNRTENQGVTGDEET